MPLEYSVCHLLLETLDMISSQTSLKLSRFQRQGVSWDGAHEQEVSLSCRLSMEALALCMSQPTSHAAFQAGGSQSVSAWSY